MAFLAIDGLICCLLVWRGEKWALASWLEAVGGGGCGAAGPAPELGSRLCTGPQSSPCALVQPDTGRLQRQQGLWNDGHRAVVLDLECTL